MSLPSQPKCLELEVAQLLSAMILVSAPVVDNNRLVRRITIDDVVDVIREERAFFHGNGGLMKTKTFTAYLKNYQTPFRLAIH